MKLMKLACGASALVALLALTGCGSPSGSVASVKTNTNLNVGLRTKGLIGANDASGTCNATCGTNEVCVQGTCVKEQYACFAWVVYQRANDGDPWTKIAASNNLVCGNFGQDELLAVAPCRAGWQFLIEYPAIFFCDEVSAGGGHTWGNCNILSASTATAGGKEGAVCVAGADTATTTAWVQFDNQLLPFGGSDLHLGIDEVCWNFKSDLFDSTRVLGVAVGPDKCKGTVADDFCVLGHITKGAISTTQVGNIPGDPAMNYIWLETGANDMYSLLFLSFDKASPGPGPIVGQNGLFLYNSPWLFAATSNGSSPLFTNYNRSEWAKTIGSFYFDPNGKQTAVGAIIRGREGVPNQTATTSVLWDWSPNCDSSFDNNALRLEFNDSDVCGGVPFGVIADPGRSPSAFNIIFDCGSGSFRKVQCDAVGMDVGISGPSDPNKIKTLCECRQAKLDWDAFILCTPVSSPY